MKLRRRSTSSRVLLPAFLLIASETASRPSVDEYCVAGARARSMLATSSSRAETPGRDADITGNVASDSGSVTTPLTPTDQALPCPFSVPPDTSRYQSRTLSAISVLVSPRAASACGLTLISSSGSRKPEAMTESTPLMRSRSLLMRRAFRRSVSSSACPTSRIDAVGKPFEVVISVTSGSLASGGSSDFDLFWISRRRSFIRLSKLRSEISRKRTRIVEMFSRDVEITKRTSATPLMPSSSGLVTSRSTSSALEPGSAVIMLTQLKLISGSCSRGIVR
jgi:hypothetical protein